MDVQELPKAPLLHFLALCDLPTTKKISEENTGHMEVLLLFLSLRYGADLGRSRLVSLSADNLTLNGPLFYNLLFICSTDFLSFRILSKGTPLHFFEVFGL